MQIPLQITFHGIDHSDAVEERIREKAQKLELACDCITSCRVVIETHHKNSSALRPFHIRIACTLPGTELVVKRDPKDSHVNEDILVALREAFDGMARQLKDHVARQRGEVKPRVAP